MPSACGLPGAEIAWWARRKLPPAFSFALTAVAALALPLPARAMHLALGRGLPVAVVQFIKGRWETGERLFAATLPQLTFLTMGEGFTWEGGDPEVHARAARAAWERAREILAAGAHRIVVLDEITHVLRHGFVPLAEALAALAARPAGVTAVVTGRGAPPEIVAAADLVTEMRSVKHPFDNGVRALSGVDF